VTISTNHYLCIGCPLGCRLEVDEEEGQIVEIRGFSCKRGKEYAEQEHLDPRRMVTSTIAVDEGFPPRLPIKTTVPVPKERVRDVCRAMRRLQVRAPVTMGDVIARDICGTGADVVASRSIHPV